MSELADTLREIADDCALDVQRMAGQPFTGRTVAEGFGNTLAMLAAVAKIAAQLAEQIEGLERTLQSRTEHLV